MSDRRLTLTTQAIRRQLAAMPYDFYLLRLVHHWTRRALPGERLWTTAQLLSPATIGFLRARNRDGYDVYIRPDAWDQNAGYILVDLDHADSSVVDRMRRNGHHPCLVLQTSPGHLQAWIHVSTSALEPCIATAVARQLAHQYRGDPASADWRHMGRLAGFTNQKLIRRSLRGYGPWVQIVHANSGLAPQGEALVRFAIERWRPLWLSTDHLKPSQSSIPSTGPNAAPAITAAQATAIYRHCMNRWRITERFSPPDWSIVDLWVARHLLSRGMSAPEVQAILQLGSPQFPRRHGDPLEYLRRTLARAAFPPRGGVCEDHAPTSMPGNTRSACSNSAGGR